MPAFVDAHESDVVALFHLTVDDGVRGGNVHKAGGSVARSVDVVHDSLDAEPVAVVVCVAGEVDGVDALICERARGFDRTGLAVIVAGIGESVVHGVAAISRVIDERTKGFLDFGRVEIFLPEAIREWVGNELADIIFISLGVSSKHGLDVVGAEGICYSADCVVAADIAIYSLVVAVP